MTKSIRTRLILNFVLIVIAVTLVFEGFLLIFLRQYYYSFAESILRTEATYSSELYTSNLADQDLSDIIMTDIDTFYDTGTGQVQILSNAGEILMDTNGDELVGTLHSSMDVDSAMHGQPGTAVYKSDVNNTRLLSVSQPLRNRNAQVGILRYTVSLDRLDGAIRNINAFFLLFGVVVVAGSVLLIVVTSDRIITPINQLLRVATRMAKGQYSLRAVETGDDEIAELGQTLNTLSDNIVEKERIKNEFISSISHELRTPLTSIKGWAITLKGEVEKEDLILAQGLDIIENESDRLSKMVEELLDFSTYTSGRMELYREETNLTDLAKLIVTQLQPRAESFSLKLGIHYTDEKIIALVDPNRMKQVIINLLDNAIKFTPAGGDVMVNVSQTEEKAILSVRDTGIGISPKEMQLVTTRFYKGTHGQSHIGLGLSIAEEIIRSHNGTFLIESIEGEETTVTIELPKETA